MMRALLLPMATVLALATGVTMIGVAATLSDTPIIISTTPVSDPTAVPAATATPARVATPDNDPFVADMAVHLSTGRVFLRVARLTLTPDESLFVAEEPEPIILLVESGAVAVQIDRTDVFGWGFDESRFDAVLHRGQQVVIHAGTIHAVRNAGDIPAVVLVMTIARETIEPDPRKRICPDPVWCGDRT